MTTLEDNAQFYRGFVDLDPAGEPASVILVTAFWRWSLVEVDCDLNGQLNDVLMNADHLVAPHPELLEAVPNPIILPPPVGEPCIYIVELDSGGVFVGGDNWHGAAHVGHVDRMRVRTDPLPGLGVVRLSVLLAHVEPNDFPGIAAPYGTDCNGNGLPDEEDIASGSSPDVDADGVPDECQQPGCVPDVNGDGVVDFADLNLLLGDYGIFGVGLPTDLDGDGFVGFADLNLLLSAYGQPC